MYFTCAAEWGNTAVCRSHGSCECFVGLQLQFIVFVFETFGWDNVDDLNRASRTTGRPNELDQRKTSKNQQTEILKWIFMRIISFTYMHNLSNDKINSQEWAINCFDVLVRIRIVYISLCLVCVCKIDRAFFHSHLFFVLSLRFNSLRIVLCVFDSAILEHNWWVGQKVHMK